jgi:hypothetical protein
VARQVAVKAKHGLWVTSAEHDLIVHQTWLIGARLGMTAQLRRR